MQLNTTPCEGGRAGLTYPSQHRENLVNTSAEGACAPLNSQAQRTDDWRNKTLERGAICVRRRDSDLRHRDRGGIKWQPAGCWIGAG